MTTASPTTIIEAARLLKQSSWNYEYNHPEKVSEAYMHDVITALELKINSLSEEQLAKAVAAEIDKWGCDDEDPKAIAEFAADGVAHALIEQLPYETVTFKLS